MKVRLQGAGLLTLCVIALTQLYTLVNRGPTHQPTLVELGLGLVAVLTGMSGVAMLAVGAKLFRKYVWPPQRPRRGYEDITRLRP